MQRVLHIVRLTLVLLVMSTPLVFNRAVAAASHPHSTKPTSLPKLVRGGSANMLHPLAPVAQSTFRTAAELNTTVPFTTTFIGPTYTLSAKRYGLQATTLLDDSVLLTGGQPTNVPATAERYDWRSDTFIPTGTMLQQRSLHTATLLSSGKVLVVGGLKGEHSVENMLRSAEVYDPATGMFTPTGPMRAARFGHTATLLHNGKVLVTGGSGYDPGAPGAERRYPPAELYDPATGMFSSTGSIRTPRQYHTATLLPNGRVLLAGGTGDGLTNDSMEIYNPATGTFSATVSMAERRSTHTATLLPDGTVLLAGGSNVGMPSYTAELYDPIKNVVTSNLIMNYLHSDHTATVLSDGTILIAAGVDFAAWNVAEIYSPATRQFTRLPRLAGRRFGHTANILPNGMVLIAGGTSSPIGAELYNPATRRFQAANSLNQYYGGHTATVLADDSVLLVGGDNIASINTAKLFIPTTKTYTITANLYLPRTHHTATLLPDGKVLVVGGSINSSSAPVYLATTEIYDPVTKTWTASGSLRIARAFHTATLLGNGKVLVAGGVTDVGDGPIETGSAELYDPATGAFSSAGYMLDRRSHHTATLLDDGRVLVIGSSEAKPDTGAEVYNPKTGAYARVGAMLHPRTSHTATKLPNGKVVIIGGKDNAIFGIHTLAEAERFNPVTNRFAPAGNMAQPRHSHSATLLPDQSIFIAGGFSGDDYPNQFGTYIASTELYENESATFTYSGELRQARYAHTTTLLPDNTLLIDGGYQATSAELGRFGNDSVVYLPLIFR